MNAPNLLSIADPICPVVATSNYKSLPHSYPGAVSISCSMPRGYSTSSVYKKLAPMGFKNAPMPEYLSRFTALLAALDPAEVLADLQALALRRAVQMGYPEDQAAGFPPVMLCFESPGNGPANFCHRQLVAAWLEEHLGIEVPEVTARDGQLKLYVPRKTKPVTEAQDALAL